MTVQGDAIPFYDSYIFLINVHGGIALVLKTLKWMSRYCNIPPVFEVFFLTPQNIVQRKANSITEGGGKNGLRSRKELETDHCNYFT